jgi:hypothetical protein
MKARETLRDVPVTRKSGASAPRKTSKTDAGFSSELPLCFLYQPNNNLSYRI